MANLFKIANLNEDMISDWADETFELMRQLVNSMQLMDGAAPDILLQAFNDYSRSMSYITYFKVRH